MQKRLTRHPPFESHGNTLQNCRPTSPYVHLPYHGQPSEGSEDGRCPGQLKGSVNSAKNVWKPTSFCRIISLHR
eukprot:04570_4